MEVINLKEFRKQIKRDNNIRRVKEQVKESIITLIESHLSIDSTESKIDLELNHIIQNIKDLI